MSESDELTSRLEKNLNRLQEALDDSEHALWHAKDEARQFERLATFRGYCMVILSVSILIITGLAVTK